MRYTTTIKFKEENQMSNSIKTIQKVPIWYKPTLSISEASVYTGISTTKLYELTDSEDCPFVLWIGNRRLVKRKLFDEFIERQYSI